MKSRTNLFSSDSDHLIYLSRFAVPFPFPSHPLLFPAEFVVGLVVASVSSKLRSEVVLVTSAGQSSGCCCCDSPSGGLAFVTCCGCDTDLMAVSSISSIVLQPALFVRFNSVSHTFSSPGTCGAQRTNWKRSGYIEINQVPFPGSYHCF